MPRTAVVIGASMAGMLAAAALARSVDTVDEVIVLERDELPDEPRPRKGLPQGRHAHILLPSGRDAIEEIVPGGGVRKRLLAAGATERGLTSGLVTLGPQGWYRRSRHHASHPLLVASRDLIDCTVRDAVLTSTTRISIRRASAAGLLGTAERVTGVRVEGGQGEEDLRAEFVVDASGRGTRIEHWLSELGITDIPKDLVDAGLVYASRLYRTPEGAEAFPPAQVTADPGCGRPGRSGLLLPIEGGRWQVSLGGTRGGEPTADPDDFVRFARGLRHPIVAELITGAEPLSDVVLSRSTRNERRYFEKTDRWPEGLIALGDAVATYNPVYGQGMSVAALGARALSGELDRTGILAPGFARRVQRAAAKVVDAADDVRRPGPVVPRRTRQVTHIRGPLAVRLHRPHGPRRHRLVPRLHRDVRGDHPPGGRPPPAPPVPPPVHTPRPGPPTPLRTTADPGGTRRPHVPERRALRPGHV